MAILPTASVHSSAFMVVLGKHGRFRKKIWENDDEPMDWPMDLWGFQDFQTKTSVKTYQRVPFVHVP